MDRFEILIDNLLIYLPVEIPFLASFVQRPEGRYVVFGLTIVIVLLIIWSLLAVLQMMFFGQASASKTDKKPTVALSEQVDNGDTVETENKDGFSFFKREQASETVEHNEDPALIAIEQEMLAVRALYADGHIIKDVYVSETRRLYAQAQTVKNSQSQLSAS